MHARTATAATASQRSTAVRHENLLVGLLALSAGLVFIDRLGISFVFPEILADLKLNNAQLGGLMGITSLAWAISSIVVSFISDALGGRAKLIIVLCLAIFSLATGLVGVAESYAGLLVIRALVGTFEGPMIPLIQSYVARASSPHRLGTNLGLVISGTSLFGNALPPVIMGALAANFGWRHSFFFLAVPGLLLAGALAMVMPPERGGNATKAHAEANPTLKDALRLLAVRNVLLGALGATALIGFTITIASFLPLYLTHLIGVSDTMRIGILSGFGIAGTLGAIIAPSLSDRLPRKSCLLVATAGVAATPALLALAASAPSLLILALLPWLLGGGALTLMIYVIPAESVPARLSATTYALLIAFGETVGGSTMPTIGGMLADRLSLAAALWFCAGVGAFAFLIASLMREPARRSAASLAGPNP